MDDLTREMWAAVKGGLHAAVKDRLTNGYSTPLNKVLDEVLAREAASLRVLLVEAIGGAVADPGFREEIRAAVRAKLAKTLVERFGGEFEKQVNQLKSDPATRAKITLFISELVEAKAG